MRFRRTIFSFLAVLVLVAVPAFGRIKPPRLEELIKQADLIVIGKVVQVHKVGEVKIAEVEIDQTVKGKMSARKIFYLATETWACDISDAKEGERSLLFLSNFLNWAEAPFFKQQGAEVPTQLARLVQGQPFFLLSWDGRGRLPFVSNREDYQQNYIIANDVVFPHSFRIVRRKNPNSNYEWDYQTLVRHSVVHSYIQQKLIEQQSNQEGSKQSKSSEVTK